MGTDIYILNRKYRKKVVRRKTEQRKTILKNADHILITVDHDPDNNDHITVTCNHVLVESIHYPVSSPHSFNSR